ncbi:MAG: carbohydrate binding family 9 domain-containing protein [Gemmatimonadetes bacterium]|nr:carbohydrate binding family 9 domain-containing protein [Gemmatimonadota bacterium]
MSSARSRRGGWTAIVLVVSLVGVSRAAGQDSSDSSAGSDASWAAPVAAAARASQTPVIDGRLDEELWSLTPAIEGFVQFEPREGEAPTERTEVRIVFDDEALYVAAWLYDSDPAGIVQGEAIRDADIKNSDAFSVILDTYLDRQNGFLFATNPAGIEHDGQVSKEGVGGEVRRRGMRQEAGSGGGYNVNWDGSWTVATSVDERGWYAEFRIPFTTLRYAGGREQRWGLNLSRQIRRKNEVDFWSRVPRNFDFYRLSRAGTLGGLEVPGHRTAYLTPYVLASAQRDYEAADAFGYPTELGGDLKVGVTPSLTLDVTYNTDFAQVEVDDQQVNLTRFPLFFPEKRPFFLENAGLFSAGTPQSVELFFSRRMGIGPGGVPVPIQGGGRLTGKVAGLTVGALHIRTGDVAGVQPENAYSVARLQRELPSRSRVGGIFVSRVTTDSSGAWNRTYGLDGRLGIGAAATIDAYVAKTETPGRTGHDGAYSVRATYETRAWELWARVIEVGEDFNPEAGFLDRRGYRFYEARVGNKVRPSSLPWLRELRPHTSWKGWFDFDGFQESGQLHIDNHVEFANGAFFSPAVNFTREGLKAPFEVAPGIVVPPGTYDNFDLAWRYNTNPGAPVSLDGTLDWAGFLSGRRRGAGATITVRRGASLSGSLRATYDKLDLAEGSFDVKLVAWRLGYFFTPHIFVQSLVQYSDRFDAWSSNLRFGWLNTAGTGLFLVYNEARGTGPREGPLNRAFILKFTRQFGLTGF